MDSLKASLDKYLSSTIKYGIKLLMHFEISTVQAFKCEWKTNFMPHFTARLTTYSSQPSPSLVQLMACRLIDPKPLSEPMLYYCQLDPQGQTFRKSYSEFKHFHSGKCIWKCRLENVGHLVSASIYWTNMATTSRTITSYVCGTGVTNAS